jgi:D-sedoheptulose 7-phosphate isomerase
LLDAQVRMNNLRDFDGVFFEAIRAHSEVVQCLQGQLADLATIARIIAGALCAGRHVFFCGNGGSAATSQHMASEIVGRFRRDRRGLPAIALTSDTSVLTAIANDYGYESVFARQVQALGHRGDVLVGISTSGNSQSVINALKAAKEEGLLAIAFTGETGGALAPIADYHFAVASRDTARIQEVQLLAGHIICDWIDREYAMAAGDLALTAEDL